jgi:hypothetical protein
MATGITGERPEHEVNRYRLLQRDASQLREFIVGKREAKRDAEALTAAENTLGIASANLQCYAQFDWLYPTEYLDDAYRALARGWSFARAA